MLFCPILVGSVSFFAFLCFCQLGGISAQGEGNIHNHICATFPAMELVVSGRDEEQVNVKGLFAFWAEDIYVGHELSLRLI
jgi:hypothetical protein